MKVVRLRTFRSLRVKTTEEYEENDGGGGKGAISNISQTIEFGTGARGDARDDTPSVIRVFIVSSGKRVRNRKKK